MTKKLNIISSVYVNGLRQVVSRITKQTDLELDDLEDVNIVSPSVGDILTWDGTNWVNSPPSGISVTTQEGITAHAGGGQGSATQLTKAYNFIDTVVTNADSAKAMPAIKGLFQYIQNNGASSLDFFPTLGDNFIGLAVNAALSIAPGGELTIVCVTTGSLRYF